LLLMLLLAAAACCLLLVGAMCSAGDRRYCAAMPGIDSRVQRPYVLLFGLVCVLSYTYYLSDIYVLRIAACSSLVACCCCSRDSSFNYRTSRCQGTEIASL
jgi:hypothetical protein